MTTKVIGRIVGREPLKDQQRAEARSGQADELAIENIHELFCGRGPTG